MVISSINNYYSDRVYVDCQYTLLYTSLPCMHVYYSDINICCNYILYCSNLNSALLYVMCMYCGLWLFPVFKDVLLVIFVRVQSMHA
jgi:hypothetical protein